MGAIVSLDEAKRTLAELASHVHSAARLTRPELMRVLGTIYAIRLSSEDRARLLSYIIEQRRLEGANRAFLMRTENAYVLPLRYVFPTVKDRTNVSRYAGALDEVRRMGTPTSGFAESVRKNGGLVELYWRARARTSKRQIRSRLTLDRNIEVISGRTVSLLLMPQPSGVFKVMECTTEPLTK